MKYALQGGIRVFNGDLTVYVLAKKHRVSQATILRDGQAILQIAAKDHGASRE